MGHTEIQPHIFILFVGHLSKKSFLPQSYKYLFSSLLLFSSNFPLKKSTSNHSNGIHINSKPRDSFDCLHYYTHSCQESIVLPWTSYSRIRNTHLKSHVLIHFTISNITHAFFGSFSDLNANVARITEFFPCYHHRKPLADVDHPLDFTYMSTRVFHSVLITINKTTLIGQIS